MNILLFGSDRFSVKCIQGIFQRKHEIFKSLDIVLPFSGGKEMRNFANHHNLKCFRAPKSTLANWTVPGRYDLALVISFGYFLPADVISKFPLGGINVHPSLLPKYRGASPIQYTILNQDPVGGVSIINLNHKSFDSGKILDQRAVDVIHPINFDTLLDKLGNVGSDMLVDTLLNFEARKANAKTQDPSAVTKAPKILKSQALVDWQNDSCATVLSKHNAFRGKFPLYSMFRSKRIQLLEIRMLDENDSVVNSDAAPGTICFDPEFKSMYIKCKDSCIAVTKVKMQDKNAIGIKDFFNGYKNLSNEVLT